MSQITCEDPEVCRQIAEVQKEILVPIVEAGVLLCVLFVVGLHLYRLRDGDPDA